MKKEVLITKIKEIINEYGSFDVMEVSTETSPCVSVQGKLVFLAEEFKKDKVVINVYKPSSFSSDPIDDYEYSYEGLTVSTLKEIYELAKEYKQLQN